MSSPSQQSGRKDYRPTVLIVEGKSTSADSLREPLEAAGWNVKKMNTTKDAWHFIKTSKIHLVLLDWVVADQPASYLLTLIRNEKIFSNLPVVILGDKKNEDDIVTALESGADDYLTQPYSPEQLIARSKALIRRMAPEYSDGVFYCGMITLDPVSGKVIVGDKEVMLRQSEFMFLKFLMAYPDQLFTRHQLLHRIWGKTTDIDEKTVDVYVLRIRKALRPAGGLIKAIRGKGYLISEK